MTAAAPAPVFQFGEFELDPIAYELRRRGRRLRLARQPMDLLLLMVGRRNELVSRDDIAARLWTPDVFLDRDAGIHTAVLRIRQVLRDSHTNPRFLETVSGKGYRFIAPVEVVARALSVAVPESSGGPSDAPPARRHNLPDELTSFVGRREAIVELRRLLGANRLVSLTGAGGVGKTRLALQIASDILHACRDGVWMVDLGPITAPDLVPQTVASVLGVRESGQRGVRDALTTSLRHRQLLIVLDTCEHLMDACADLVDALLRDAPGVRILATTREPLGVRGEAVFRVPSLTLPVARAEIDGQAPDSEAVQLFVERAMTVDATFKASEADAGAIGRICQRLDGIPLAIELAAARVTLLSPAQIETRLQDRFRLLTGGARTAVARQRTLEAAVEWSCQLLSDSERLLLGRLSVFPASWTIEAAESICSGDGLDPGDVLELSSRLVAKSLVGLQRDQEGTARFRLLETVRQYARERVVPPDAGERLRTRHAGFFANQFRDALSVLRGAGQLPYLAQLQAEQENVRTALEWALASSPLAAQGVALTGSLFWFWTKRGLFEEGRQWLERALALEPTGLTRARVLIGLAHMHYFQGRHVAAAEAASEAHALGETLHHGWTVSFALFMLALTSFELGQCECAAATATAARAAADAGGDPIQHGGPLMILANVALQAGDRDRAQAYYEESIAVHRREGDIWGLCILLSIAAGLHILQRDMDRARAYATEAMTLSEAMGDPRGLAWGLEVCAGLMADEGHAELAAQLWGASDGLMEAVGGALAPTIGWIRDRYVDLVCLALGDAGFARASGAGRAMFAAQALELARQHVLRSGADRATPHILTSR